MYSTMFLIYLFTRLDSIVTALIVGTIFTFVAIFFVGLNYSCEVDLRRYGREHYAEMYKRLLKRLCVTLGIMVILLIAIPSKKDAAIILAGTGIIEAAKTDEAKRLTGKSLELIEQTLDSYLEKNKNAKEKQ